MKSVAALAVGFAMLLTAIPGAEAIASPWLSGPNVKGNATVWTAGSHHDIDRKHCNWLGCNWLDGTNTNTDGNNITTAVRGAHCGSHRYRHQGQTGDTTTAQLTYFC